ncbi:MAG: CDP-diacylglycerol--serine O-phosphatidyltransferase [Bacteroidetes bacterium]|nr:CDP-diacylglycerol--serine O-phosphatidyltransferase [Bacteroidota bacterium]
MKKNIPNFITLLNLLSGIFSIIAVVSSHLDWAVFFIVIAAIFDFLDGTFGRLLDAQSEFGKQLDSLADLVSFGLAPGFIMFALIDVSEPLPNITIAEFNIVSSIAFLIPLFSAWRLARFNIDTRQTENFIGLPTPASALLISSIVLINLQIFSNNNFFQKITTNTWVLLIIVVIICLWQVAETPLISLKFNRLNWRDNQARYLLLIISIILIIVLQVIAIPLIMIAYLILSKIYLK